MKRERDDAIEPIGDSLCRFGIILQHPVMKVLIENISDITVGRLLRVSHEVRKVVSLVLKVVRRTSWACWLSYNIRFAAGTNIEWIRHSIKTTKGIDTYFIRAFGQSDSIEAHVIISERLQRDDGGIIRRVAGGAVAGGAVAGGAVAGGAVAGGAVAGGAFDKTILYLTTAANYSTLPALMLADGQTVRTSIPHSTIAMLLIRESKYDLLARAVVHPLWTEIVDELGYNLLNLVHSQRGDVTDPAARDTRIKVWKLINIGVYIAKTRDLIIPSNVLDGIEAKCGNYGLPFDVHLTEQNIRSDSYPAGPLTVPIDVLLPQLHFCKGKSSRCIRCYTDALNYSFDNLLSNFPAYTFPFSELTIQYGNVIGLRFDTFSPDEQLKLVSHTQGGLRSTLLRNLLDKLFTRGIIAVDNSMIIKEYLGLGKLDDEKIHNYKNAIGYLNHFHNTGAVFAGTEIADVCVCKTIPFAFGHRIALRRELVNLYSQGIITPTRKQYDCIITCMRKSKTARNQLQKILVCFGGMYQPADLE